MQGTLNEDPLNTSSDTRCWFMVSNTLWGIHFKNPLKPHSTTLSTDYPDCSASDNLQLALYGLFFFFVSAQTDELCAYQFFKHSFCGQYGFSLPSVICYWVVHWSVCNKGVYLSKGAIDDVALRKGEKKNNLQSAEISSHWDWYRMGGHAQDTFWTTWWQLVWAKDQYCWAEHFDFFEAMNQSEDVSGMGVLGCLFLFSGQCCSLTC